MQLLSNATLGSLVAAGALVAAIGCGANAAQPTAGLQAAPVHSSPEPPSPSPSPPPSSSSNDNSYTSGGEGGGAAGGAGGAGG